MNLPNKSNLANTIDLRKRKLHLPLKLHQEKQSLKRYQLKLQPLKKKFKKKKWLLKSNMIIIILMSNQLEVANNIMPLMNSLQVVVIREMHLTSNQQVVGIKVQCLMNILLEEVIMLSMSNPLVEVIKTTRWMNIPPQMKKSKNQKFLTKNLQLKLRSPVPLMSNPRKPMNSMNNLLVVINKQMTLMSNPLEEVIKEINLMNSQQVEETREMLLMNIQQEVNPLLVDQMNNHQVQGVAITLITLMIWILSELKARTLSPNQNHLLDQLLRNLSWLRKKRNQMMLK